MRIFLSFSTFTLFILSSLSSFAQLEKNFLISPGYSLYGMSAAPAANGEFLIVCRGDSLMENQQSFIEPLYLFRVDQLGDSLWTKQYNISNLETPHRIRKTNDNNYIILAESYSSQIILIKITPNGELLWEERHDAPYNNNFWLQDMIISENGDILVTGWDMDNSSVYRPFVLRADQDGNEIWYRDDYTSDLIDITGTSLAEDSNGDLYLSGRIDPQPGGGSWDHNICVTKVAPNGDMIWQKDYEGFSNNGDPDYAYSIIVSNDNHLILTGESFDASYGYVTNFLKLDLAGNLIAQNQYTNGEISGFSIAECANGDFYISGKGFDGSLSNSYINSIIKVDNNGQLIWSQFYCNYTAINPYTIVNGISREIHLLSDDKWFSVGDIVFGEAIEINSMYLEPASLYIITPDMFVSSGEFRQEIDLVAVYPNPSSDFVNISFKNGEPSIVQLIDINGVVHGEVAVADNIYKLTLNLNSYKAGNYILRVISKEGSQNVKLIVQ